MLDRDNEDWKLASGPTPTLGTGPAQAAEVIVKGYWKAPRKQKVFWAIAQMPNGPPYLLFRHLVALLILERITESSLNIIAA